MTTEKFLQVITKLSRVSLDPGHRNKHSFYSRWKVSRWKFSSSFDRVLAVVDRMSESRNKLERSTARGSGAKKGRWRDTEDREAGRSGCQL